MVKFNPILLVATLFVGTAVSLPVSNIRERSLNLMDDNGDLGARDMNDVASVVFSREPGLFDKFIPVCARAFDEKDDTLSTREFEIDDLKERGLKFGKRKGGLIKFGVCRTAPDPKAAVQKAFSIVAQIQEQIKTRKFKHIKM